MHVHLHSEGMLLIPGRLDEELLPYTPIPNSWIAAVCEYASVSAVEWVTQLRIESHQWFCKRK